MEPPARRDPPHAGIANPNAVFYVHRLPRLHTPLEAAVNEGPIVGVEGDRDLHDDAARRTAGGADLDGAVRRRRRGRRLLHPHRASWGWGISGTRRTTPCTATDHPFSCSSVARLRPSSRRSTSQRQEVPRKSTPCCSGGCHRGCQIGCRNFPTPSRVLGRQCGRRGVRHRRCRNREVWPARHTPYLFGVR